MHEMQNIVTDDRGVCPKVCQSVRQPVCHAAEVGGVKWRQVGGACSVQPLPNHFGLLLLYVPV